MKLKLKEILAKDAADLTEAEKAFLCDQVDSLTDEQKAKFADVLADEKELDLDDVKAAINEPLSAFEKKIDKMAETIVEKFQKGVMESPAKGQSNDEGSDVVDADSTRDFLKALISGDKSEVKRVSSEAWKSALKSTDKATRSRAKALQKALSTSSSGDAPDDAQAGLLVPPELLAEVLRIRETQYGLARRSFRYLPFSGPGNQRTIPALGTSVSVYWIDEGGKKKSTQPKFNVVTQTLKKLAAIVPLTEEIVEDSAINLTALLGDLFAEAVSKEEDIQFFAGTGTPWTGILNNGSVNVVNQQSGDVNQLTADDLLDMIDGTPTGALAGAKFYMNRKTLSIIRKLKASTTGEYIFQRPADGLHGTIWDYPYELSDAFPEPTDVGTGDPYIMFGNLQQAAVFGDKQQLRVKLLDQATITDTDDETVLNLAEQDMIALRIVERVGYVLALPKAVTVLKASAHES